MLFLVRASSFHFNGGKHLLMCVGSVWLIILFAMYFSQIFARNCSTGSGKGARDAVCWTHRRRNKWLESERAFRTIDNMVMRTHNFAWILRIATGIFQANAAEEVCVWNVFCALELWCGVIYWCYSTFFLIFTHPVQSRKLLTNLKWIQQ